MIGLIGLNDGEICHDVLDVDRVGLRVLVKEVDISNVVVDVVEVLTQRMVGVQREKEHAQFGSLDDALLLFEFLEALIAGDEGVFVWAGVEKVEHPEELW